MLSKIRAEVLVKGLNSSARHVWDAIPLAEPWPFTMIVAEVKRKGHHMPYNILQGCVNRLVEIGVVAETVPGTFIRAPVRAETMKTFIANVNERTPVTVLPTAPIITKKRPAADRLGDLAAKLRNLADEFDSLALDLDEEYAGMSRKMEAADKLRALMKELGT